MAGEKTTDKDIKKMGLNAAETQLWRAFEAGEPCDFDKDAPEDERTLRGDILGKILRRDPIEGVAALDLPRQVRIAHAIISGPFDMSDTQTNLPLTMEHCEFHERLNFARSRFVLLDFEYSTFKQGADFSDIVIQSDLWLRNLKSKGEIFGHGANIGGQLSASDATLAYPGGDAINAQGAKIQDSVFIDRATLTGCLNMVRVNIGGQLSANDATLSNPDGDAIKAHSAHIQRGVFLRGSQVNGCTNFMGADIEFQFAVEGSRFMNPHRAALLLQGTSV